MKKILSTTIILLFYIISYAQVPAIVAAAGFNSKGFTDYIEGGIWYKQKYPGIFVGLATYNINKEYISKEGVSSYSKEPILDPYLRINVKLTPIDDCASKFISSLTLISSIKANFGGSYRICYRDYDSMFALEPTYQLKSGIALYFSFFKSF